MDCNFPKVGNVHVQGHTVIGRNDLGHSETWSGWFFKVLITNLLGATVQDDVAFGLENNGVPHDEMKKRVQDALERVHMADFLDQEPHHLSGGQKQRVAIAGCHCFKAKSYYS